MAILGSVANVRLYFRTTHRKAVLSILVRREYDVDTTQNVTRVVAEALPRGLRAQRCVTAGLVLTAVVVSAAGCSSGGDRGSTTPPAASSTTTHTTTATAPPNEYDISRIGAMQASLPAGFDATSIPRATLSQEQIDAPGVGGLSSAPPATVDPPACAATLKPLGAVGVGGDSEGFIATTGPHIIVVMAARAPHPFTTPIDQIGCEHVSVTSPDGISGTVDRIPGPDIPGAKTVGAQAHLTMPGADSITDEYTFTATLGDRTVAVVQGDTDPALLRDILTKAVATLQG